MAQGHTKVVDSQALLPEPPDDTHN
jgi:hypothetical protein